MKQLSIVLCLLLILSLCGCASHTMPEDTLETEYFTLPLPPGILCNALPDEGPCTVELYEKQDYETAAQLRDIEKKPSTSELVDWLRALVAGGVDVERIDTEIPFAGVLLKKDKDLQTLRKNLR